jgi:uncharacterized Zn-binding protein involved in type VI secretion
MADEIEDPDDSSESEDSSESGDEISSSEGGGGGDGGEKKEEEEDGRKVKSGYGQEWKKQESLGQTEGTYTKKEGWEKEKPEEAEKGPERKITLWQYTPKWGDPDKNRGYWKGVEKWGDQTKEDEKGKFFTSKAEFGQGYHEWGAVSEGSIDLNKKEFNLTAIDLKGKVSLDHGEASAKFKLGAWVASLFKTSEKPEAPAPSGVPGMGALMAARVGDMTSHGSPLFPGMGSANVFIGSMPAWRTLMDFHLCPIVKGIIPDIGGVVMMGSPTVFINFMNACRISDMVVEIPGGPNAIAVGCPTVFIGNAGGGGGAAGDGGAEGGDSGGEKKEEGEGVVVEGKATGDIWAAEGEANLGAVFKPGEKVMAGGKISALASVFKGSIEGGITIPLWGKHSITLGGEASGFAAGIGGEAHADAGWTKEKGYHASVGLKGAFGFGGGAGFSIGFK